MPRVSSYAPFSVGSRFRIAAPGTPPGDGRRIDLMVARGAFGSGEHETTSSCLEALERLGDLAGLDVLDLGAGTGVLAVAALRLGARHAVLVDTDARAVAAAHHHADLNGVADRVTIVHGDIDRVPGPCDLALANLHGDILVKVAPALVARTRPGGRLVLSGILWGGNWDVRACYERLGCAVVENRFLDEYTTVVLVRAAAGTAA